MHKSYKVFLVRFVIAVIIVLSIVVAINYTVDPYKIYTKKNYSDKYLTSMLNSIKESTHGVLLEGVGERAIKMALSLDAGNYDCVVMGSSTTVQFSNIIEPNMIPQCKKLLNLSVSICTIEDIAIYSYMILNNTKKPKKIYIGLIEWLLILDKYQNYIRYKDIYNSMKDELNSNNNQTSITSIIYNFKLIKNLINIEYLFASINYLLDKDNNDSLFKQGNINLKMSNELNINNGSSTNVVLKDGAMVYSSSYIRNHKNKDIDINNETFEYINNRSSLRISDFNEEELSFVYSKEGEELLIKLIKLYKKNNIEVNFIFTPFNFEKINDINNLRKAILLEKVFKKIAIKENIKIFGSLFPNEIDCNSSEFYDSMHAQTKCLKKIFQ